MIICCGPAAMGMPEQLGANSSCEATFDWQMLQVGLLLLHLCWQLVRFSML